MTNSDFRRIQESLGLSGRDLAQKLGVTPSSVSHWREEREIPDYIARLMTYLQDEQIRELKIPLSIEEIIALSKAAEAKSITVEALLLDVIRGIIKRPVSYTTDATKAEAAAQPAAELTAAQVFADAVSCPRSCRFPAPCPASRRIDFGPAKKTLHKTLTIPRDVA